MYRLKIHNVERGSNAGSDLTYKAGSSQRLNGILHMKGCPSKRLD